MTKNNSSRKNVNPTPLVQSEPNVQSEQLNKNNKLNQPRFYEHMSEDVVSQLRFIKSFDEFQHKLDSQLNELKILRTESKRLLLSYEQDLQKVQKSKRKRRTNFEPTGFIKKSLLPNDLADLLNVEHGTLLSTPEITKRFYAVLDERKLYDEKDHRIFRPDLQTRKVFGLSPDVLLSDSYKDKNGFNFMTLQKHLSQCLKQVNNQKSSEVPQPVVMNEIKKKNKTSISPSSVSTSS